MKERPFMIAGWKLVQEARRQPVSKTTKRPPAGALPAIWFRSNAVKANVDTHTFPDNCALELATLTAWEEFAYVMMSLYMFGMFIFIPVTIVLLFVFLHFAVALGILVTALSAIYLWPADW